MSDLAAFLLARIAEDEAGTQAWVWIPENGNAGRYVPGSHQPPTPRELAECDAKRRIVAEVGDGRHPHQAPSPWPDAEVVAWTCQACGRSGNDGRDCPVDWRPPSHVLRALALPYAGHPDFDEAWRL